MIWHDSKLSIVIPCYGSQNYLSSVVSDIVQTISSGNVQDYEIILVSDASPDGVYKVIQEISLSNEHIKGVELSRNFGQHAALMAGYAQVSGDIVVSMDDDGQTPASGIFELTDAISANCDVVFAKYPHIKQSSFRRIGSAINRVMMEILIQKPKTISTTSFFAAKRYVVDAILQYKTPYPYIQGSIFQITTKIANVLVPHQSRLQGKSTYKMGALLRLWLNGFTAFSVKPLRFASIVGALVALAGLIYAIYLVVQRIITPDIPMGYTSTMAALLFIGGMIMLILGMLGEYVGRIYLSMNGTPQYIVKEHTTDMAQPNGAGSVSQDITRSR